MEVHDGSVIDSCIAAADDGQDVHDAQPQFANSTVGEQTR